MFIKKEARMISLLGTLTFLVIGHSGCTYHDEAGYVKTPYPSPLHQALFINAPTEEIEAIILAHPELINQFSKEFGAPIDMAIGEGRSDIVPLLFEKGIEINQMSKPSLRYTKGVSLLHRAVFHRNLEIVKFLLDRGIDTSIDCEGYGTALDVARSKGYSKIVVCLEENAKKEAVLKIEARDKLLVALPKKSIRDTEQDEGTPKKQNKPDE